MTVSRDRRYHGGAPEHLDEDKLAELAEEERVDAGLDAYNPDEVPPATDPLPEGFRSGARTRATSRNTRRRAGKRRRTSPTTRGSRRPGTTSNPPHYYGM